MQNKDKFKTIRQTRQADNAGKDGEAKFYLDGMANALRPPMGVCLGSYAVHIYSNDVTRELSFVTQEKLKLDGNAEDVTEFIVSKSLDELRLQLMAKFGRLPSGRKEK